jgi:hypothetical protein
VTIYNRVGGSYVLILKVMEREIDQVATSNPQSIGVLLFFYYSGYVEYLGDIIGATLDGSIRRLHLQSSMAVEFPSLCFDVCVFVPPRSKSHERAYICSNFRSRWMREH